MSISETTGEFNWTPTQLQIGNHDVTISVGDGDLSDGESITITVNAVNDAPGLSAIGDRTVDEDALLNFTVSATDDDSPDLTFSLDPTSLTKGMSISETTGEFNWTPTQSQIGNHDVTITVSDGDLSDGESITITVNAVNDVPVLVVNTVASVDQGEVTTITSNQLMTTDEDNSAEEIQYTISALPENGTLVKNSIDLGLNGTFTQEDINNNLVSYRHDGFNAAADEFSFVVSDGQASLPAAGFQISINIITALEPDVMHMATAYPIPSNKEVIVRMENTYRGRVLFSITDATGKVRFSEEADKTGQELTRTIDISQWPQGLFFLKVTLANRSQILKLLKN
jgi:hypothetical protein